MEERKIRSYVSTNIIILKLPSQITFKHTLIPHPQKTVEL